MPMYSYRCPECGRQFEELLSLAQRDNAVCPECGAKAQREWTGKCSFGAKYTGSAPEIPEGCAGCPCHCERNMRQ